ncbi:MAG TPA: RluA family pseudouridine synthase [Verrucomicrobiae bacterium]|nr:RluA family pseudouridine synthase [Verrucomicrobiae bacterium]
MGGSAGESVIKLSSPATKEFWEISVVFEDEHLLAINKPASLLTSPDGDDPERPDLMKLLHRDIERGASWATQRNLTYLMNAHRLDSETSGVLLLAKNKPALVALANLFGSEQLTNIYVALVHGTPEEDSFRIEAKLAPHPTKPGLIRVDPRRGKRSVTEVTVRESFDRYTLLECRPRTARPHQIGAHLRYVRLPIVGDAQYGGRPLLLSKIKRNYRLKEGDVERPLIATRALHGERLVIPHPVAGNEVSMEAPWPKDLTVAVKYLRRFAP